jgi:hypothetical protein
LRVPKTYKKCRRRIKVPGGRLFILPIQIHGSERLAHGLHALARRLFFSPTAAAVFR